MDSSNILMGRFHFRGIYFRINRIEVTHQERNDVIRLQMQELTRKVANLDYVASKIESTLEGVKTEVESLKDLDRFSRNSQPDQYAASASSSVSGSSAVVPEKLNSLAVLTTSVASAVNRIEREIHIMSRNTTQLMQSVNYLQRNVPTKQYLNTAILGLKNQPIYAVMQSSPSEVTSLTSSSSGNQSIPTNCKYAVRRFGVTKIQLFSNNMREPFFVNCIDGWTVSVNVVFLDNNSLSSSPSKLIQNSQARRSRVNYLHSFHCGFSQCTFPGKFVFIHPHCGVSFMT